MKLTITEIETDDNKITFFINTASIAEKTSA